MPKRARPHDDAGGFREASKGKTDGRLQVGQSPAMSTRLPRKKASVKRKPALTEKDLQRAGNYGTTVEVIAQVTPTGRVKPVMLRYFREPTEYQPIEDTSERQAIAVQPQGNLHGKRMPGIDLLLPKPVGNLRNGR